MWIIWDTPSHCLYVSVLSLSLSIHLSLSPCSLQIPAICEGESQIRSRVRATHLEVSANRLILEVLYLDFWWIAKRIGRGRGILMQTKVTAPPVVVFYVDLLPNHFQRIN